MKLINWVNDCIKEYGKQDVKDCKQQIINTTQTEINLICNIDKILAIMNFTTTIYVTINTMLFFYKLSNYLPNPFIFLEKL